MASAEVASGAKERRRGLRGRSGIDGALVIPHCRWVHTFGMRFPIDIAYVDDEGRVVKTTAMKPRRLGAPVTPATWVIEAGRGSLERWGLAVGHVVELRDDDG